MEEQYYIATERYDTGGGRIYGVGNSPRQAMERAEERRPNGVELFAWPATAELAKAATGDGRGIPWNLKNWQVATLEPASVAT